MGTSARKKIKYHIDKISADITSIKSHLNYIVDEIGFDYPHISTLIVVVDDIMDMVKTDFIDTLDNHF